MHILLCLDVGSPVNYMTRTIEYCVCDKGGGGGKHCSK